MRMMARAWLALLILCCAGAAAAQAQDVSFAREVAPILQKQCVGCHREGKAKGKYRLDSYQRAMEALVAGNLEKSELFQRITSDDEDERMPADADPLPIEQVATIRRWIELGAKFDADDPAAPLSSIIPATPHPAPPATYRRPIPIAAMAISEDGKQLFTGGYHEILVWDPDGGHLLRRIADNGQRTYDLALSPDGRLLAAATGSPGEAGELRVFDAATGVVVATPLRSADVALSVAFSPDGAQLACGAADGKLRIFDCATWEESLLIGAHSDWVNALAWNAQGTRIATASRDKTAKVFDTKAAGKRLITFSGHGEAVRGVAFHPGGEEVISCGDDGLLLRWKIGDGKKSGDLANFGKPALRLRSSAAGYFATADGHAVQFASADQKRGREFSLTPPATALTQCLAHGARLFVGTFDGRVITFDLESGGQLGDFLAVPTPTPTPTPAPTPREPQAAQQNWPSFRGAGACGVADGQALPEKWDAESGTGIRFKVAIPGLAHSGPIVWGERLFLTTAISSRGGESFKPGLYVLNNDGRFACYDLAGGDEVYYERIPHRAHGFSASPVAADGKIYLAGEDGLVFVVAAGAELKLLATNPLGEPLMATPAMSDGVIYLRGSKHLLSVGK